MHEPIVSCWRTEIGHFFICGNGSFVWLKLITLTNVVVNSAPGVNSHEQISITKTILTHLPTGAAYMRQGIASYSSYPPIRCQAINKTNAWLLSIGPLWTKLQWNFHQNSKFFIQENAFENVVFEMAAILSRGDGLKCHLSWIYEIKPRSVDKSYRKSGCELLCFLRHSVSDMFDKDICGFLIIC